MNKFFCTLAIIIVCYSIFFDLRYGTLPSVPKREEEVAVASTMKSSFFEEKVQAGDTVLSIVENNLNAQIPVSIHKVVNDFQELNAGLSPERIQIGKIYRFPDYSNQ
jgi:hypothetical protein